MKILSSDLTKVKVAFLFSNPFLSTLALSLEHLESNRDSLFSTDGKRIYINKTLADRYSFEELKYKYAHIILHIALRHNLRRGERELDIWNVASNVSVNLILSELSEVGSIPFDEVIDEDLRGKSVEEIYNELFKESESNEIDSSDLDLIDAKESIDDNLIFQALGVAKQSNTVSSSFLMEIDEITKIDIGIEDILKDYLTVSFFDRNYSYIRPNKRFKDVYLPSTVYANESLKIIIALDCSASVSLEDYKKFLGLIESISEEFGEFKIKIIPFDSEVREDLILDIEEKSEVSIPKPNGGTNFDKVSEYLENQNLNEYSMLLVITDGLFEFSRLIMETIFLISDKKNLKNFEDIARAIEFKV